MTAMPLTQSEQPAPPPPAPRDDCSAFVATVVVPQFCPRLSDDEFRQDRPRDDDGCLLRVGDIFALEILVSSPGGRTGSDDTLREQSEAAARIRQTQGQQTSTSPAAIET